MDRTRLPIRHQPFKGVAKRTLVGSKPNWEIIGHGEPPEHLRRAGQHAGLHRCRRRRAALQSLPPDRALLADAPKSATGGQVTLFVNDKPVGVGRLDHTVPFRFSRYSGMDIGRDKGAVVDRSHADEATFTFTGTVKQVVFDIKPNLSSFDEQELHEEAHRGHLVHGMRA